MIHDWRAVILKEQQHSYQHSVENEWMVTQHRHRGMLFASVNGFISQFALGSARAHGTLTARSSLPACSGAFWKSIDYLVPTSSRKDCGYEPHRWWFQCPLEYQTWRLNISQLTTDWTRGKCPRRSRAGAGRRMLQSFHKATSSPLWSRWWLSMVDPTAGGRVGRGRCRGQRGRRQGW